MLTKILLMRKAELKIVAKYPYETAKSYKFIADHYPNIFEDKNALINYYNIAADYFSKASYDLAEKSYKLWHLTSNRLQHVIIGLEILVEDIDLIFNRYSFDVKNAIQNGLAYGFDDSKVKIIQADFEKKTIDSNRLSAECFSIASCYKNLNSEENIMTCIKGVKE